MVRYRIHKIPPLIRNLIQISLVCYVPIDSQTFQVASFIQVLPPLFCRGLSPPSHPCLVPPTLKFLNFVSRITFDVEYCIVVEFRRLVHCSRRLIVHTLVFSRSYLHRQVSPPETLVVKGGTTLARNGPVIWTESCDFHAYTFGFFYMPQICDMGQMTLLPFRRKVF